MTKQTEKWIKKAQEDEKVAEILLASEFPVFAAICFHLQQAAEKYVKALVVENNISMSKTHNIVQIIDEKLLQIYPEFENLSDAAALLTDFGIEPRYPGDYPEFTASDSEKALEAMNQIKEAIMSKLNN